MTASDQSRTPSGGATNAWVETPYAGYSQRKEMQEPQQIRSDSATISTVGIHATSSVRLGRRLKGQPTLLTKTPGSHRATHTYHTWLQSFTNHPLPGELLPPDQQGVPRDRSRGVWGGCSKTVLLHARQGLRDYTASHQSGGLSPLQY